MDKSILDKRWFQELLILVVAFMLSMLNSWDLLTDWQNANRAIEIFLVTYVHAQVNRYFLLPLLLQKQKSVTYFAYSALLVLIFSAIMHMVFSSQHYFVDIICCVLSLVTMLTPFLLLHFYTEQKKQVAVQLAMNQMELKVLQSQLNPHFLFNTFNNIYGISLQDPTGVSELILQVSRLMRYHLESHTRQWVTLEEELSFIEGYIALEEERVGKRCTIKYEYFNETGSTSFLIAPLLLMAYIENAFKHGADKFININILVSDEMMDLKIRNAFLLQKTDVAGIGLKNAKHRLNLLYNNKYKLDINSDAGIFTVQLILPLIKDKNAE